MKKRDFKLFVSAAVIGAAVLSAVPSSAQLSLPGGGTFDLFGPPGLSPERHVLLNAKNGPFNVITGEFGMPGGGELDWHINPGVAIITVTEGTVNEFHSNGCVSLYEPGDVFYEAEGQVHKIVNPSATEGAKAIITFIAPVGSNLVTFVPPPASRPCTPGHDTSDPDEEQQAAELADIKQAVDESSKAAAEIQNLLTRIARALSLNP